VVSYLFLQEVAASELTAILLHEDRVEFFIVYPFDPSNSRNDPCAK